jgi:hypothetical protein
VSSLGEKKRRYKITEGMDNSDEDRRCAVRCAVRTDRRLHGWLDGVCVFSGMSRSLGDGGGEKVGSMAGGTTSFYLQRSKLLDEPGIHSPERGEAILSAISTLLPRESSIEEAWQALHPLFRSKPRTWTGVTSLLHFRKSSSRKFSASRARAC